MAITKEKKIDILAKLKEMLSDAKSAVFVNFHGLSVNETSAFRRALKESGVKYFVAKKTLIRLALGDKKFEGEVPSLEGEIALATGDDLLAPAREVYEFSKKYKDNVQIVGGVFDGRYMNMSEMLEVAQIPSREVLYGRLVGLLNWPLASLAMVAGQIAEQKND
ncbi:MAG TPA: 50S ribosomal protein L10 [Candidatus Vogelbacteria bacterium]|nr:50S ribosomal protein L10 [Candidatus Vogelbacteria bacterium]